MNPIKQLGYLLAVLVLMFVGGIFGDEDNGSEMDAE